MDEIAYYIVRYRELSRTKIRLLRICQQLVKDHNALYEVEDISSAEVLARLNQLLTMARFQEHLTADECIMVYQQLCFEYPLEEYEEEQA